MGAVENTAVLEAVNLYRFFHTGGEETLALRGVSLRVASGEIVAVTGPSGSGKSTLLACLAGLDEPDGGMVSIVGHELSRRSESERAQLRASHIGLLFQTNNLLEHLTVEGNVALVQKLARSRRRTPVGALLEELGISHRRGSRPSQLSGGETARAGLAVTLANNPAVIVADEPTGELDTDSAVSILELLKARAAAGSAVIVVTHSSAVAAVADREVKLRDGVIVSEPSANR